MPFALPRRSFQDLSIRPLRHGLASNLARSFWFLVVARIGLISSMCEDGIPPLAIDEEVPHFVKNLAIWLKSVWLQEEHLRSFGLFCIGLKLLRFGTQEISGAAIYCSAAKE